MRTGTPSEVLYHYTTIDAFFGISSNRELWATNSFYLNDTEETRYVANLYIDAICDFDVNQQQKATFWLSHYFQQRAPADIFVCCFSRLMDSLSQWRGYTPTGGVGIGFNKERLSSLVGENVYIRDVEYNLKAQIELVRPQVAIAIPVCPPIPSSAEQFAQGLKVITGALDSSFYDDFQILSAHLKHPSFAEENETRLIIIGGKDEQFFRSKGRHIVPYKKINLESCVDSGFLYQRVVLSPSRDDFWNRQHSLEAMLSSHGLKSRFWQESGVPFQDI